jgi:hypothetical protein
MRFARYLGLLDAAPDRVSHLLIAQLYEQAALAGIASVASRAVIEIKAQEGIRQSRGMKGLQPFLEPPLCGLHKFHYLSHVLPGMPQNLLNEMRLPDQRERLETLIQKRLAERLTLSDTRSFDEELAAEVSGLVVRQFWAERLSRGAGTGDWIVVAYHQGKNFYLTTVVAPKSPDISHGAAWAAMNSRGERYPSDLCG